MIESIETINQRLKDYYGCAFDNNPNYRIVFSDDQFENRLTEYDNNGFHLIHPEVRLLPKYSYIKGKHLIERYMEVPWANLGDVTSKLTYEPVFVFEDAQGNALPFQWAVIKIVLGAVHQAAANSIGVKYKDPNLEVRNEKEARELLESEISAVEKVLFANENSITDALAYREGVGYTGPSTVVPVATQEEKET